ncbi:group III truncated hemoglobin [Hwanghaeella grinnelliae]|uniref:Group III truncated hemoglobin n=1 Tax=Hwanghaeella grinnelliae TaxID=2500179 RepID=A0A3S2Z648_9PROT|nr:group III truncated hemoglobin [Hwanghaeella grinnelliae]RVU35019.1 group III truncated hemoglobin [Hwanghaeella grinnelliae]
MTDISKPEPDQFDDDRGPASRRRPLHPEIDEAVIESLVRDFYGKIQQDETLSPIFGARIEDWEPHLRTMMDFWSSVTLMTGRYKGQPMQKHRLMTDVEPAHFDRWLALFRESARAVAAPEAAEVFITCAERIAGSFKLGMFGVPGLGPITWGPAAKAP